MVNDGNEDCFADVSSGNAAHDAIYTLAWAGFYQGMEADYEIYTAFFDTLLDNKE